MHGRRALAAAAAVVLLISLFAPWYRESIVARGVTGLRTMTFTRSGWSAFSSTEVLVLIVAVVALVIVAAAPVAAGDARSGRLRMSGAIIAALGAIAFVVVLVRLTTAPGTTGHALADTMVAVRWGIFLALGSSAVLAVAGLRLIGAPGPDVAAPVRRGRRPRPDPAARSGRADRVAAPARSDRTPRPGRPPRADRVRPSGGRTEGRVPSPAPARRSERPRPARHADRPRWEDQATGWLDLPD
jgi:hypothetical protein